MVFSDRENSQAVSSANAWIAWSRRSRSWASRLACSSRRCWSGSPAKAEYSVLPTWKAIPMTGMTLPTICSATLPMVTGPTPLNSVGSHCLPTFSTLTTCSALSMLLA
ncbi:hypothetical protein D3C79_912460 [compost metagenome]